MLRHATRSHTGCTDAAEANAFPNDQQWHTNVRSVRMYVCHFDMMKKMGVVEKASCIKHVWVVSSFSVCGGWRMSSLVQMLIGRKHAADML